MAASVLHLLETLETRLEQKNAELTALREENQQLKQQLAALTAHAPETPAPMLAAETERSAADSHASQSLPEPAPSVTSSAEPDAPDTPAAPPSPQALLKQWYQRYPNAFFKGHTKPLKVGIHQDLAEREPWSGKLIRRALANYVNLPRYIKSMREGAERVDLDGQPAGKVDKEAVQHASERRHESPTKNASDRSATPAKSSANKTKARADKLHRHDQQPASKPVTSEKIEQKKPLSMEEKLKGLQQKFEGR